MEDRKISFGGGPTHLSQTVRVALHEKLFTHDESYFSLSSNSREFNELQEKLRRNLKAILNIPVEKEVVLTGGGAHLHFAALPRLYGNVDSNYTTTGYFSKLAFSEAQKVSKPHSICGITLNENDEFILPETFEMWQGARYTHFVDNESVEGVEYPDNRFPLSQNCDLIMDCSSSFLTKPINWNQVDIAYAHTQKNIGISGLTIIVCDRAKLMKISTDPSNKPPLLDLCDWHSYLAKGYPGSISIVPLLACEKITFQMLNNNGVFLRQYSKRSSEMWRVLDRYSIYKPKVQKDVRSRISITWTMEELLQNKWLIAAEERGLVELKGHRTVGGLRASLFSSLSDDHVRQLVQSLQDFGELHSS